MSGLSLKNNFYLCYPILEKDLPSVYHKIKTTIDRRVPFYELRIDYLLEQGVATHSIIDCINDLVKTFSNKKFIVTIRTKNEGGAIDIPFDEYYVYVKELVEKSKAHYIDIEYKYYILDLAAFNTLIEKFKVKTILSKHIFSDKFSKEKCEEMINCLIKTKCSIAKLAMTVCEKKDLFYFMNTAKEYSRKLKESNKNAIFIAMGEMGRLSRIYPEYTNTRIVFINAYNNGSILGQYSHNNYIEYRKLLAKLGKN